MVLMKILNFSSFFLDKMGQENAFDDILHRKKGLSMRLPRTFTQATSVSRVVVRVARETQEAASIFFNAFS